MFCTGCGKEVLEKDSFCPGCGKRIGVGIVRSDSSVPSDITPADFVTNTSEENNSETESVFLPKVTILAFGKGKGMLGRHRNMTFKDQSGRVSLMCTARKRGNPVYIRAASQVTGAATEGNANADLDYLFRIEPEISLLGFVRRCTVIDNRENIVGTMNWLGGPLVTKWELTDVAGRIMHIDEDVGGFHYLWKILTINSWRSNYKRPKTMVLIAESRRIGTIVRSGSNFSPWYAIPEFAALGSHIDPRLIVAAMTAEFICMPK